MNSFRTTGSRSRAVRLAVATLIAGSLVLAGCQHDRHRGQRHRDSDEHHQHGKHPSDHQNHGDQHHD